MLLKRSVTEFEVHVLNTIIETTCSILVGHVVFCYILLSSVRIWRTNFIDI